jgi:hypothetical protein
MINITYCGKQPEPDQNFRLKMILESIRRHGIIMTDATGKSVEVSKIATQ